MARTRNAVPARLLVDTGAFYAQRDPGDAHHDRATRAFEVLSAAGGEIYSTEHIMDETITLLARRESYAYAAGAGEELLTSRVLRWLDATPAEWKDALRFMRKYADQAVSFTDCISFSLMKREGIKHVFGFDRHFEAAGFHLWPPMD
jgi:predicted nucleic acid-binding protein